ncbi:hypothetical protein SteCoe_19575 [Stentor coeruleus]|uniref:MORN repeat-containing protein n=1 Tax=Stentor coeruleus TaxID=5963 RepID=A0A1R2BTY3_9CILI|nr:hypothetical protein SteCoe_19575 [Stentor coeruleus]
MNSFSEKPSKGSNLDSKDTFKRLKNTNFWLLIEKVNPLEKQTIMDAYLSYPDDPDFHLNKLGGKIKFVKKPHALLDKSLYIGEAIDNKPNGLGYHMDINGNYYEGFFENGKFNGKGRLITTKGQIISGYWNSGSCSYGKIYNFQSKFYEGELKNLEPDGIGREVAEDYNYNGGFSMSKKHGEGKVVWKDGNWYEGEFYMGKIEGKGKYHWKDSEYEGSWKVNKMHGQGIQVWSDGSRYEGHMEKGLKHGYGVYKTENKVYSGFWKHGKEDGKGKLVENGEIIEGLWLNGKFLTSDTSSFISEDLHDSLRFKNLIVRKINFSDIKIPKKIAVKCANVLQIREKFGPLDWGIDEQISISENRWKKVLSGIYFGETTLNNIPHGRGIWLNSSQIYEGFFIQGERHGFGRLIDLCNEVYTGNWTRGIKQGFGVFIKPGAQYSGDWEENNFNGLGILITDEIDYEGEWRNNFQHGKGVLKHSDENVYKGEFSNGKIEGIGYLVYPNGNGFLAKWNDGECVEILKKFRKEKEIEEREEKCMEVDIENEMEEARQLEELKQLILILS